MEIENRTIFAACTLIGDSSISVIRISGKDSFVICSKFFSRSSDKLDAFDLSSAASHTLHHGYIFQEGEIIDEVILSVFRAPHSFTGEDVVEISLHGGFYVYKRVAGILSMEGCSHAEPGEFSKRAFLNGKMDLAQAEAVSDLIRAKTDLSSKAAIEQLEGKLSGKINFLRENLINLISLVELELDFSEEGLELIKREDLETRLKQIIEDIEKMTKSYESGRIVKEGINLAIIGPSNAGKSSIFNYLLKKNRSIVSDIPGTTRDYIEDSLIMEGIVFNLVDTAGLRDSTDIIEKEGIRRTHEKLKESDIVVTVIDLSVPFDNGYGTPVEKVGELMVYNKMDISIKKADGLCVSAKTGENMNILQEKLVNMANSIIHYPEIKSELLVTNERHSTCLLKSCEYLVKALDLVKNREGNELISFEIKESIHSLEEIIGKTTNVDILNNIFSKFCIGK